MQFCEAAGARVVPLVLGEPAKTTLDKLGKCNGVLFPGGDDDGYFEFGRFIFEQIKQINDSGQFYPLFGICQGHENMAMYVSDMGRSVLNRLPAIDVPLTLEFVGSSTNKLFSGLTDAQRKEYELHPVLQNAHNWGISPDSFLSDLGLASVFHPTSISFTPASKEPFVASMESSAYPFFSVQFHPRKSSSLPQARELCTRNSRLE